MVQTRRKVGTPRGGSASGQSEQTQIILERLDQQQRMIEEMRADQVRRDQERDATIATLVATVERLKTPEMPAGETSRVPPPNEQSGHEELVTNPQSFQQLMKQFQQYNPPVFDGTMDVQTAEDWVEQMNGIFRTMDCSSESKARLAAFKLVKEARRWWRNAEMILQAQGTQVTWESFQGQFREKYFPQSVRDAREAEFLRLRQGETEPFDEFVAKFLRLANYSTYLSWRKDDEWLTKRLIDSLNSAMQDRIAPQQLTQFNKAVEVCRLTERSMLAHAKTLTLPSIKEAKANQSSEGGQLKNPPGSGARVNNQKKRKQQQFNKGPEKQLKGDACSQCGRRHGNQPCRAGQTGCFRCGEIGHYMRDCPRELKESRPPTTGRVFALSSVQPLGSASGKDKDLP